MSVVFKTNVGDMFVDLFYDIYPLLCFNFIKLCKLKYFNGCLVYSVERDTFFQLGDPTNSGYSGETFLDIMTNRFGQSIDSIKDFIVKEGMCPSGSELPIIVRNNRIYIVDATQEAHYVKSRGLPYKFDSIGCLAMAHSGNNTIGSQFFITSSIRELSYLNNRHSIFGVVEDSNEVIEKINEMRLDGNKRPYENVLVEDVVIVEDPFKDPTGVVYKRCIVCIDGKSYYRHNVDKLLSSYRHSMECTQKIKDVNVNEESILAEKQKKEDESRSVTLEILGDIPSKDITPPKNVLFICKLNPHTSENDLKIIFSRFGEIISCQIIRHPTTLKSYQYGFIEFKQIGSCEEAYSKMNNVIIDDRRIHVDFSQSVSHLYRRYANSKRLRQ